MSTSDSVAMRVWPMACVPLNPAAVLLETRAASPRSLISSSAVPMRQDLGPLDVFDIVGELAPVAVEP